MFRRRIEDVDIYKARISRHLFLQGRIESVPELRLVQKHAFFVKFDSFLRQDVDFHDLIEPAGCFLPFAFEPTNILQSC